MPSTGEIDLGPGDGADVEARGGRRLLAAVAAHEVVLHPAAAGEDVGELLAQVAAAEAVADRRERHGVTAVHGVEGHGRGHLAGHRQQHVHVLDTSDNERLVGLDRASERGLGGAGGYARRRLAGDGVHDPDRE